MDLAKCTNSGVTSISMLVQFLYLLCWDSLVLVGMRPPAQCHPNVCKDKDSLLHCELSIQLLEGNHNSENHAISLHGHNQR